MSKNEKILKKIGSNKVDWVKLGDVCTFTRGKPLSSSDTIPGDVPVISGGQKPSFYHNCPNRVRNTITVAGSGASAGFVSYWEIPIWVADAFTVVPYEKLTLKYVYYFLKNNQEKIYRLQKGAGVPHVHGNDIAGLKIPVPQIAIQNLIVLILDSFSTLIVKMKQEVELRKKQMEYYRDKFYGGDFEGMKALRNNPGNSIVPFADLGEITRGRRFVREDIRVSGQPCIHYGDMYTCYGTKCDKTQTYLDRDYPKRMRYAHKGDVVIVGAGENDEDIGVGLVWMGDEPAAVHDACYILEHNLNPMYVSYYLRTNIYHQQLKQYVSSGKICSFSQKGLGKVLFPIQSDEKQRSIVSILDAFETYISKLEQLIALHEKQYAYYREKLLTFD